MVDNVNSQTAFNLEDLRISPVTRDDLPALEWDGEFKKYRRMYARLYRNTQTGTTLMWVVKTPAGEIIGQAFVMLKSGEREAADGKTRAYVFAFRVKSAWRGMGIGSHLMNFVETDLRRRSLKAVTLNVSKDNHDALRLYRRLGYRVTGSRPGVWSYTDHEGVVHHVNEPAWRMIKYLI